jgi:hypothetical protein
MTALDRRTASARAVLAFRARLEQDRGGHEDLSTQTQTAAELLARETAYLDHFDAYLMGHTTVLTKNRRALVRECGAIVDRIAPLLALVGLERQARRAGSYAAALLRTPSSQGAAGRAEQRADEGKARPGPSEGEEGDL